MRKESDPPDERTKHVRVVFVRGGARIIRADSFAEAAKRVKCAEGAILCFVWSTPVERSFIND